MDNDNITANEQFLSAIFTNNKYTMDYFQREYMWQSEHIEQMINDLTQDFDSQYDESKTNNTEDDIKKFYNSYFMGSIILYKKDGKLSIIDGQQRLTSLTLLLIYLRNKMNELRKLSGGKFFKYLDNYICSEDAYNNTTFYINIPGREECLNELYNKGEYKPKEDSNVSIKNMSDRYNDIESCFSDFCKDKDENYLLAFITWLINKVAFVVVIAPSEEKAYIIFETMNNRGLSLTNTEMLKGFILSKITDVNKREDFSKIWKNDMEELDKYKKRRNEKIDDAFFQAWLKSQFAETFRQNKKGSDNGDMENINTRFHNWFKDNYDKNLLGKAIDNNMDYFMENNYKFYFKWFKKIKEAEKTFSDELKYIYYINSYSIAESLKYPLLLAPLNHNDSAEIVKEKLELVANYIDGFAVRYAVNSKRFGYSYIDFRMNSLVKRIR
ncbi:MAG: DUF262 domain-containing protein, partial [Bacteroidetes bacterium]|nr:DUF262 domain-containing protein [Bacteroidota bacterium]